jgi:glycosyltransferase involved in cell wall biosynthesis
VTLVRVLFFNEGNLGSQIMGQGQLEAALRAGLPGLPDVNARFAGLTPMGRLARTATRPLPVLTKHNLDFDAPRWHLVQSLRARAALQRELQEWPAEVVHVHSHSVAFAMGATMARLPVVLSLDTTVRDWWAMPAWRPPQRHAAAAIAISAAMERRALSKAALVIAWTGWARRAVEAAAPQAQVAEHHPGLDLERYRPAPRSERSLPRVLFVGGAFARKGGKDLLEALGDDLGSTVELDLVTPEKVPERPGMRVHRLGPSDPQLLRLQQQADVFCLPTHGDAAPWAVLEAMACATPVLSTRIGGIPDLLDEGRAGMLVEHRDGRALAEGLRTLLSDASLRAELAANARARCEARYDARVQTPRLIELLRESRI